MLKLNVGLNRKVGEPDYGSRGASVHLELEVESSLAGDPEAVQERIRSLFRLARASIETELNGNGASSHGDGHANGNGQDHNNQSNGSRRSNGRSATASQVRAIHAIASRQRIDLAANCAAALASIGLTTFDPRGQRVHRRYQAANRMGTEGDDDCGTRHLQPEQDRRTDHRTRLPSFSAVSLYQRCPLAFKFRYIDGLPEETVSSSLAFGGGVHAALELWFREQMCGNDAPDQDTLLSEFWDSWRCKNEEATINFGKGEDVTSIGELADRVLAAFRESELAKPVGTIIGVEEELRGPVVAETPDILARIDLLIETNEALTVIDFKTARSRWSDGQAQDQAEQLLLYSELARRLAPGKELRLEFHVLHQD